MTCEKVLIVEDDEHSRFLMSEMLDELGVAYEVAEDGEQCMKLLDRRPCVFDAIFMDVHMPNKSGVEALHEIRSSKIDPPKNVRVVAVSADIYWHNETNAKQAGFDTVLPKPVNFNGFAGLLR